MGQEWSIQLSESGCRIPDWTWRGFRGSGVTTLFANRYAEDTQDLWINNTFSTSEKLSVDAGLFLQRHRRDAIFDQFFALGLQPLSQLLSVNQNFDDESLNPRLGLVYQKTPGLLMRVALQKWQRPASFGFWRP